MSFRGPGVDQAAHVDGARRFDGPCSGQRGQELLSWDQGAGRKMFTIIIQKDRGARHIAQTTKGTAAKTREILPEAYPKQVGRSRQKHPATHAKQQSSD